MRIGETRQVEVDGVVLDVAMSWGQVKALQAEARRLEGDAEGLAEMAERTLLQHVVGVSGLEWADGRQVERLTAEVLNAMPADWVAKALLALASPEGVDTGPLPFETR